MKATHGCKIPACTDRGTGYYVGGIGGVCKRHYDAALRIGWKDSQRAMQNAAPSLITGLSPMDQLNRLNGLDAFGRGIPHV